MRAFRVFQTAIRALRRNIMRSILTAFGIVIGCGAVIAMMEIGNGSAAALRKTIASMGSNNLLIQSGTAASGGISFGAGTVLTLTPEDGTAILKECPAVENLAPVVRVRTQVVYGSRNWVPPFIFGTTPDFLDVRDWNLTIGDMFTDRDVRNASKVCVVGQTLARELFGGESPVGRDIRIKNVPFRIVGVLARKGANTMGMDQDDVVLAPWTTIKYRVSNTSAQTAVQTSTAITDPTQRVNTLSELYPSLQPSLYPVPSASQLANTPQPVRYSNVDQLQVKVATTEQIPIAIKQMTELLRERHRLRHGEADDFSIRDMTEPARNMAATTKLMTNLLLVVACISLFVGGVGIMNIMLVSVTERTREIGLRMAVGARAADILRQFLVEAVLLCLMGGIVGILLGRLGSIAIRELMNWQTESSLPAIIASFVVSVTVGIIFGYYPAWKASRLDPIEALRYE